MPEQTGWRKCAKCLGLFYSSGERSGVCPADGSEHLDAGTDYGLLHHTEGQQQGWAHCRKCQGLFFTGNSQGICPAKGEHLNQNSYPYVITLREQNPRGETGWKYCFKCQGLFHGAADKSPGSCPAGGAHDPSRSGQYSLTNRAPELPPIDIRDPRQPLSWRNWAFEARWRDWTREGQAFSAEPATSNPPHTLRVAPSLASMPLGGDYWYEGYSFPVDVPAGNQGQYWVRSADAAKGTATSPPVTITQPFLTFLIGGPVNPLIRVELQLLPANHQGAVRESDWRFDRMSTALGSDTMRREVWDVRTLAGRRARIRIVDDSTNAHILVDDFRFTDRDPRPELVAVPGYPGKFDPVVAEHLTGLGVQAPLWGIADVHCHPMATLGFGGKAFGGHYEPGQGLSGLRHCDNVHGIGGTGLDFRGFLPSHGIRQLLKLIFLAGANDNPIFQWGHLTGGNDQFDGWPRFSTLAHQTMHIDWIQRAYQGGLRLMCALAVNTELVARLFEGVNCDDQSSIDVQLKWMKALAAHNSAWMEIAYTPADARRIIASNKLAVVLGVEVDSALGLWKKRSDLPADPQAARIKIVTRLDELYRQGVRQINPLHVTNNAFGGCSVYNDKFLVNNYYCTGEYFQVEGAADVDYRVSFNGESQLMAAGLPASEIANRGGAGTALLAAAGELAGRNAFHPPPAYDEIANGQGHANALGLTDAGRIAIVEMMRRGILIDIDHMSRKAANETLSIAELPNHNYPILSAHTSFRDCSTRGAAHHLKEVVRHEGEKTPEQVARIRRLRGMVAPIVHANQSQHPGSSIRDTCCGSSTTWAQEYLYAVEQMNYENVALGTDRNVLLSAPAPRFGPWVAWGLFALEPDLAEMRRQADQQSAGVRYRTPLKDWRFYRFQPARAAHTEQVAYSQLERDIWEAIAIYKCGVDPDSADQPVGRPLDWSNRIKNIAKGFHRAVDGRPLEDPLVFGGNTYAEQRAAFLVLKGLHPDTSHPEETRRLHPIIQAIWLKWHQMEGPNVPLERSYAGRRDFDYNIDGYAHYGLLPDFLQDLKNQGMTGRQLAPLFRSAEDFVSMWERCEDRSRNIQE